MLIQKYNQPIPRYTSYPTVPNWNSWDNAAHWTDLVQKAYQLYPKAEGIALYIHLPYCEQLCTYCGCNKKITSNHAVEQPYIGQLLREWEQYVAAFGNRPLIRELHLGGGTPTFFAPEQLERLINGLFTLADRHPEAELSFEGHPNNTTEAHLRSLYTLGFRRVSYGVQDLDPEVQRLINRIQPFERVEEVCRISRETGYNSVNFDLIYGLPKQSLTGLRQTISQVVTLKPDRIAFYGYAHVPWKSRAQRLYDEQDLPSPAERVALYMSGRELLLDAGYIELGMDHFALPGEALARAAVEKRMHRNFMGYTTSNSRMLIGLGVSAISDLGIAFGQNSRELVQWQRAVEAGEWAIVKGMELTVEDMQRRQLILDMSCKNETHLPACWRFTEAQQQLMQQMLTDELLIKKGNFLRISDKGRLMTRHACSLFDGYLQPEQQGVLRFSQAI